MVELDENVTAKEARMILDLPCFSGVTAISVLEGGLTNRNFKVTDGAGSYAVRFVEDDPVLGIDRKAEKTALENAARRGVAPNILCAMPGVIVTVFAEGETLTSATANDPEVLASVTKTIKQLHQSPVPFEGTLPSVSPLDAVLQHLGNIRRLGIKMDWDADTLEKEAKALQSGIPASKPAFVHADLLPGNIIYDKKTGKAQLIDFEYAAMGDPLSDLAWFSVSAKLSDASNKAMLQNYFGEAAPQMEQGFNNMRALVALRDALWGVVQTHNSSMDNNYREYADRFYSAYKQFSPKP